MSSATIENQAIGDGVLTHTIFRAKFREVDSDSSVSYKLSLQVLGLWGFVLSWFSDHWIILSQVITAHPLVHIVRVNCFRYKLNRKQLRDAYLGRCDGDLGRDWKAKLNRKTFAPKINTSTTPVESLCYDVGRLCGAWSVQIHLLAHLARCRRIKFR